MPIGMIFGYLVGRRRAILAIAENGAAPWVAERYLNRLKRAVHAIRVLPSDEAAWLGETLSKLRERPETAPLIDEAWLGKQVSVAVPEDENGETSSSSSRETTLRALMERAEGESRSQ